jgi:hypothetical protein
MKKLYNYGDFSIYFAVNFQINFKTNLKIKILSKKVDYFQVSLDNINNETVF